MTNLLRAKIWFILIAVAASSIGSSIALAHENRDLGQYQLTVGFLVEPAFEGLKNGVDLRVVRVREDGSEEPVEGVEDTLQVEVTHVPTGVSRTMNLRAVFGEPGHYTADLIPTALGHYRFRFSGEIEGTAVDETFDSESGGGGFGDIESSVDIQFPAQVPAVREIEGAVRGAQDAALEAQTAAMNASNSASSATTLAIIGIVLGVVGIVSGIGGVALGMRRR